MNKAEAIMIINNSGKLPATPSILNKLISVNSEEINIIQVSKILEQDKTVVMTLLKTANSAMYNVNNSNITNIETAIVKIGIKECLNIATSINIAYSFLYGTKKEINNVKLFWVRSYLTAKTAVFSAKIHDPSESYMSYNDIYTTALLQSIGRVVLSSCVDFCYFNEKMQSLSDKEILIEEELRYGINYIEAGQIILKNWGIPKSIIDNIKECNFDIPCDISYIGMVCCEASSIVKEKMSHIKTFSQATLEIKNILETFYNED